MAERQTILFFGDDTIAGTRPVSELAAINAAYDDVQADCDIWNIQTQSWQALQPGVNSHTLVPASDRWSFESRIRESLRSKIPTGKIYVIKYGVDSSLLAHPALSKPVWDIGLDDAYRSMMVEVTAAAAAANAAGDTLRIVGIVSSIVTEDWTQTSLCREFNAVYSRLIDTVRSALSNVPHCLMGSLRGDGGLTPWVVLEPHYQWGTSAGFNVSEAILFNVRMRTQMLEVDASRIRVVRTDGYTTDTKGFSAASMVALSTEIADHFYPFTAPAESALPVAEMVFLFGDSLAEGTGTNSELPTYRQAALQDCLIWYPFLATPFNAGAGEFQTLQVQKNNMTSIVPHFAFTNHGLEIALSDQLRPEYGTVHLVKGGIPGTLATAVYAPSLSATVPPTIDQQINNWHPGLRGQLFDLFVRGWMVSALKALRRAGKKPRARLCVISLGANDLLLAASGSYQTGSSTIDYVPRIMSAVEEVIEEITRTLRLWGVDVSLLKFSLAIPRSGMAGSFNTTENDVQAFRAALAALAAKRPNTFSVDLDGMAVVDFIHLSTVGYDSWADAIVKKLGVTTSSDFKIEPLFMPSGEALRKALRLSQVPDQNDATAQIDAGIEASKVRFFQALGETRIASLQAIAYTTNPKTASDYLRVLAASTEVKIVRSQLLRVMPTLFMDGSSRVQTWNEEAAFRDGSTVLEKRDELKRLDQEIQQALDVLASSDLSLGSISVALLGADNVTKPGDSVFSVI